MYKLLFATILGLTSTWAFAKPMFFSIPKQQKQFYFQLDANPTTGYQWKVTSYDKQVLKFIRSEYHHSSPQMIGSGGKMRFYFATLQSNIDTTVYLDYGRPWEKSVAYSREVHIKSK